MVKSCDSALALGELFASASSASASTPHAGSIMDVTAQGLRSSKALGIGELLASACSASAPGSAGSIIDIIRRGKANNKP